MISFLDTLRAEFPTDFATTEATELREYGKDWTKVWEPAPLAVCFPRTTDEVSRLLRLANAHDVAVVPSGGRTGLAGGAVAANGEVVLSLTRMRRIDPIDFLGSTVRVQAGAITEAVHKHCEEHGLTWPVDFASKGSSQIGGNIATNAGGVKVIKYGLTRNWVLGLQVVLMDGTVLELNGALEKNNTGIDLRQLFIGSEGVLGVITEAVLKLAPVPKKLDVFLFAVPDLAGVLRLFRAIRNAKVPLSAFEFFTDKCLTRLQKHRSVQAPFSEIYTHYVLCELDGAGDLDAFLESLFTDGLIADGVMAQHGAEARKLWELREGISESLSATGLPHKNDIALPISALESFTNALESGMTERYPGWEVCIFGHIGDGNLHVNVMKPDALSKEEFLAKTHEADALLFDLVKTHKGSISAEHGVGLLKRDFLAYSRSAAEIDLMLSLKKVFDPKGLLNPGKIFK